MKNRNESPFIPNGPVLNVVDIHYGEVFPESYRSAYLQNPTPGNSLLSAFPAAREQKKRCLNGLHPYGNLNAQFGEIPTVIPGRQLTPFETETLNITRKHARHVLKVAATYDEVVELHGCGYDLDTHAWIGRFPTIGTLSLLKAIECDKVILAPDITLSGRLGKGVILEVADKDTRGTDFFRDKLAQLATSSLPYTDASFLRALRVFEVVNMMDPKEHDDLGLNGSYKPWEPLPQYVSNQLGYDKRPAFMLAFDSARRMGEIAIEADISALTLPKSLLAGIT